MTKNRNQYNAIFELYADKPWLLDKKDGLEALLNLCKSEKETNLVYSLLKNFKYIDQKVSEEFLENIVTQMQIGWGLDASKTQVVATAVDDSPDSSQQILQQLKPVFSHKDWHPKKLLNNINKAKRYVEDCPNVVLVDEFVGTGRTIKGRVNLLRQTILDYEKSNKKKLPHNIYVCVLAAMQGAKKTIEALNIEYHIALELKRGISDHYPKKEVPNIINDMIRIESELDHTVLPKNFSEFPSLGWGKAEALYAMENGHVPNSVFPVFWWAKLKGGASHTPLFSRYEDYYD